MSERAAFPRAVFLDTQVFVEHNFQYAHGSLAAFGQHVRAGRIEHVITEVTIGEIHKKIAEGVEEARKALRRFQKDARILRNSRSANIGRRFKPLARKQTRAELREQFGDFLSALGTTIVQADVASPSEVFQRYFGGRPPFSNPGKPKKKAEFPDAFAMEALRVHAEHQDRHITIVSKDSDWDAFSKDQPRLELVEGLEELLQDLQQDSSLFEAARVAVAALEEQISKRVAEECVSLDFFVADADAAIVDVVVAEISLREPQIIDVTDNTFICAMQAAVEFDVAVDYLDLSSMHPAVARGLAGFRAARIQPDPDEPAVLNAFESFRIVLAGEWDPTSPEEAKLLEVRVVDPRPVPLYYDEYSGS